MTHRFASPALLGLLVLASGCASTSAEYPSLAIRDVERMSTAAPQERGPLPAPAPATLAQLDPLLAEARTAHAAFTAAVPHTRALVQAAGGSGSDSWSVAQVALADLRSHRSTAMIPLASLDRLYNEAASAGESTSAISPVRDAAAAMLAEEDAVLDRLIGTIAP